MALSFHMSYHLLKLLFSTICDLMTSSENTEDKNAVLCLRDFLTNGLGSKIITMMSSDLDLSVSLPSAVINFLFLMDFFFD